MPLLNNIARQVFRKALRSSGDTATPALHMQTEAIHKPLHPLKKAAYQFEAKRQLSSTKTPDKQLFNAIKARLDKDTVVLDMAKKKIADRDWSGLNLSGINFDEAKLTNIQVTGSRMDGCGLSRTYATKCDFSGTRLTEAKAEYFHGRTSTFKGATIGGNWRKSDLPATIRDGTDVTIQEGTQLEDVCYPDLGWQKIHDIMRRTGNTDKNQVRRALLAHSKVNTKELQFTPYAPQVRNGSISSSPKTTAPQRLKTMVDGIDSQVDTLPPNLPHQSQYRSSVRSGGSGQSNSGSLLSSVLESTPPTSLEGSISSLSRPGLVSDADCIMDLSVSTSSKTPKVQATVANPSLVELPHQKLSKIPFNLKAAFPVSRKSNDSLPAKIKKFEMFAEELPSKNSSSQPDSSVWKKDSDTLMAEWDTWLSDWQSRVNSILYSPLR